MHTILWAFTCTANHKWQACMICYIARYHMSGELHNFVPRSVAMWKLTLFCYNSFKGPMQHCCIACFWHNIALKPCARYHKLSECHSSPALCMVFSACSSSPHDLQNKEGKLKCFVCKIKAHKQAINAPLQQTAHIYKIIQDRHLPKIDWQITSQC